MVSSVIGKPMKFVYRGKVRTGVVENVGIGPHGRYITLKQYDDKYGERPYFKSYSVKRMTRVEGA